MVLLWRQCYHPTPQARPAADPAALPPFSIAGHSQLYPAISSLDWQSTFVPLMFVLLVTAAKDGYDDYGRHKSDSRENNRMSRVLDGKTLVAQSSRCIAAAYGTLPPAVDLLPDICLLLPPSKAG